MATSNLASGYPLTVGGLIPTPGVPQAEQMSLQLQANGLIGLTNRAHEFLDRLTGVGATPSTNAADMGLSGALQTAGENLMRLNQRLEDLQRYVGMI